MTEVIWDAAFTVSILCSYWVLRFVSSGSLFKNTLWVLLSLCDKSLTLSGPSPQKVLLSGRLLGPGFPTISCLGHHGAAASVDESLWWADECSCGVFLLWCCHQQPLMDAVEGIDMPQRSLGFAGCGLPRESSFGPPPGQRHPIVSPATGPSLCQLSPPGAIKECHLGPPVSHSGRLCSLAFWTLLHNQVVKGSLDWFRCSFRETAIAQWSISLHPKGLGMPLSEGPDKSGPGNLCFPGQCSIQGCLSAILY